MYFCKLHIVDICTLGAVCKVNQQQANKLEWNWTDWFYCLNLNVYYLYYYYYYYRSLFQNIFKWNYIPIPILIQKNKLYENKKNKKEIKEIYLLKSTIGKKWIEEINN